MIIKSNEIVSIKYAIGLEDKTVLDIAIKDMNVKAGETLWEILGKIDGVRDVDYDGHFGNYIYIEIDEDNNTPATWELIYNLINNYL